MKRKNYGTLYDIFEGIATISWLAMITLAMITLIWLPLGAEALIALLIAVPCEIIAQYIKKRKT